MYHCHIRFYLTGHRCKLFEIIKELPPLDHFTHEFMEESKPSEESAAMADVILANLQGTDVKKAVCTLLSGKRKEAELILLADREQISSFSEKLTEIKDIWTLPMSDEEMRFRFIRWQENQKMNKDFWQTSQYLEATINHVPNLIWYKDKNGIHEKVNDSFCRTVNKTKNQVEGRSHAYIWDVEQDDPACIESEHEVMQRKETCISEEIVKSGDGTKLLTTYKSPLYDLNGDVMGTVGVAIDVTQERAYEQEIIDKNYTLETIFTTMDCGVMCHTMDGSRIISINRAALKVLGYESQEELLADGFDMVAESVVDEDKPVLRKKIKELKNEGDNISVEYRVRHKNGEVLHIMGNVKLIRQNGELVYQRFLLDCTVQKLEQKKNERHHMELIHALSIEYNLVCFFELDTGAGMSLRLSDENYHIFDSVFGGEISLEENMGLYIQKYVHEEDREMMRRASSREKLRAELTEKRQYYVNYRVVKNGEITYFQMRAVRAGQWKEGHGIVLGFRSVDEEIRNEMKKKELLEDALLQANEANKAKSVFLSNMSHDIRTPMNAIVGFTTLAISHIGNTEQVKEYLGKIMTSGEHLLNLINNVLDMSRIESGKMHLEEKPCCLPDMLQGLRNIVQADVHAKQLELYIETSDIVHEEIICDKLRLNQVLLNILSNSVKYTDAGGSISMRIIEETGAPAGHVSYEFHIKDTGVGMSEEFVAHIFEPFEREKNTTISGIQGTGLGMAITKNIVDMMNGAIEVRSEQGVGTEFIVSFTFRVNDEGAEPKEKDFREKKDFRAGRILLAEDNELNQEIAAAILEDAGFSVEIAGNGQIAVDMLKAAGPNYYQLVLMDVQMPVMDGYSATRFIRGLDDKKLSAIPIFAMTANAFEEDRRDALKSGMNGHIAKPIDIEKLFETLSMVLD
ncbi:PAS domain S-box protein [Lachnospiraceae bacterium MD308]|nr:PAS domain S-box protein [Lachnospiraceae bacterium MD308]MCI8580175.1 PAS domain S-box protein [Dorea sp.]